MSSRGVPVNFDWHDYLELANELCDQTKTSELSDALLRSAISRAYFAIFCLARDYLVDKEGYTVTKKDSHTDVINQFKGKNNNDKQKIYISLTRLREDRKKADYYNIVKGLNKLATSVMIGAAKTIEILDSL